MSYILIDNATLTATQRLSGQAPSKTKDLVDMDILALENFVQAILFYDDIIALDNYIEEHSQSRIKDFDFIRFVDCKKYSLPEIESKAHKESKNLSPTIEGGEFSDENFKNFFKLLNTHIKCTWDISSSVYYLTLKVLAEQNSQDFDKYGALAAAIFSELQDNSAAKRKVPKHNITLIDQHGEEIHEGYKIPNARWPGRNTGGMTPALKAFVASLVWLSNRTILYTLSARHLHADTILYPIRQSYQQYYIDKSCNFDMNYVKNITKKLSSSISQDIISIHSPHNIQTIKIEYPIFTAWIANRTKDPARIVEEALSIRDEKEFCAARESLKLIQKYIDENKLDLANKDCLKIMKAIEKNSVKIREKFSVQSRQGSPIQTFVKVFNSLSSWTGISLPELDVSIPLPDWLDNLRKKKGISMIYRNVTKELQAVWALGKARDILGAKVVVDKDAIVYSPKNEDPRYQYSHSPFKSPM